MKFLTFCNEGYESLGNISIPVMRQYCERHNIKFCLHQKVTRPYVDVYWNKIVIVREALETADWVIWCDADILILVQDFNWSDFINHSPDINLFISSDYRGLCLGFFLLRSCQWSKDLFRAMEFLGEISKEKLGLYDVKDRKEQDTLKNLADFYPSVKTKIELISETVVSNPKSAKIDAFFAHHFWSNSGIERTVAEMQQMADSCLK